MSIGDADFFRNGTESSAVRVVKLEAELDRLRAEVATLKGALFAVMRSDEELAKARAALQKHDALNAGSGVPTPAPPSKEE